MKSELPGDTKMWQRTSYIVLAQLYELEEFIYPGPSLSFSPKYNPCIQLRLLLFERAIFVPWRSTFSSVLKY